MRSTRTATHTNTHIANPSSLVTGSSSHKKIDQSVSRILRYYYNDSRVLFVFCFCNELFFVALYLMAFIDTPIYSGVALTWPQLLALLNFPVMFGKQVINCVQFWKAAKIVSWSCDVAPSVTSGDRRAHR